MSMGKCDFCNYDDFKPQIIYEDELVCILYPRKPVFSYHFMVVPKQHIATFNQLDKKNLFKVHNAITLLHTKFKSGYQESYEGYNIFSNNGSAHVGQKVPHFHMHVFIRLKDEAASPYKIMNNPDLKVVLSAKDHYENVKKFHKLLQ